MDENTVIESFDMAEWGDELYHIGCTHRGRYPQVDYYAACVQDNYELILICDECNEEGAQDI